MIALLPPGWLLLAAALIAAFLPARLRAMLTLAATFAALALMLWPDQTASVTLSLWGHGLELHQWQSGSWLAYGVLLPLALIGLSPHLSPRALPPALLTSGAALCLLMAGDGHSISLYLALLGIGAVLLTDRPGNAESRAAACRMAVLFFLLWLLMFKGFDWHAASLHRTGLEPLPLTQHAIFSALTIGGWLMAASLAIWLLLPPLSCWLRDAAAGGGEAAQLLLPAAMLLPGLHLASLLLPEMSWLLPLGAFMLTYGVIYAINAPPPHAANYLAVAITGAVLAGIGLGGAAAIAATHALAFAGLTLLTMLIWLGQQGQHETVAATHPAGHPASAATSHAARAFMLIAALALAGMPYGLPGSGLVQLRLLAAEGGATAHWWLFLLAPPLLLIAALAAFWPLIQRLPNLSGLPLAVAVTLTLGLLAIIFWPVAGDGLAPAIMLQQWQLLLFGGVVAALALPGLPARRHLPLDWDALYRGFGLRAARYAGWVWQCMIAAKDRAMDFGYRQLLRAISRHHAMDGYFARTLTTGATLMWVGVIFGLYMLAYYFVPAK